MTTRVAVLDDFQGAARRMGDWDSLTDCAVTIFPDHLADEAAVAERLQPFEVIVAMRERTPFPASLIARLPNLKLLVTTGARNNAIDMKAAAERGVLVCGTGGVATSTAELAWALLMALARHLPAEDRALREGRWQTTVGTGLAGKTLGIIGLGKQGARVAHYGRAFDMDVIGWSPNLTPERAEAAGVRFVSKDELITTSDFISVHIVLGATTRNLVSADDIARMKPSVRIVNTSRGPIIDEAALCQALHDGRIAGAALDVYSEEPLPMDAPIRKAPNTVLSPHLGYVSEESYRVFYGEAVEDIRAFLAGKPVRVLSGKA